MDAKEALYVVCRRGVFVLPEAIFESLSALVENGFFFVRQDDEVLTISTQKLVEGHRRAINARFKVPMFRDARKLAIVNLRDSVRVMVVS
ncbi:MAG TPA: hypothetical protein VF608_04190 [Thermoanaerobaculia bacterium]